MSQPGMEMAVEMPAAHDADRPGAFVGAVQRRSAGRSVREWIRIGALPVSAALALTVHQAFPNTGPRITTHSYAIVLVAAIVVGILGSILQGFWRVARHFVKDKAPLLAAGILVLCVWEVITVKLGLLPLMYFPGPETILQTLVDDRRQLFDSTWHSLSLLLGGYVLGTLAGLVSGITIGWSSNFRYWGMPVLKIVGPIPATAWIPMALIIFPQSVAAGIFLIALTVWFPVTMLTASGVSNVRQSYLDVARTLGANERYLIFRVAIPAAMPSIFIGLFMGLGASFLTLLVAESMGVSSGLGWYIDWARNYSDYNKVFAALIIMAAFFSTIMTLLFKVRDRILVWQKGTIKW